MGRDDEQAKWQMSAQKSGSIVTSDSFCPSLFSLSPCHFLSYSDHLSEHLSIPHCTHLTIEKHYLPISIQKSRLRILVGPLWSDDSQSLLLKMREEGGQGVSYEPSRYSKSYLPPGLLSQFLQCMHLLKEITSFLLKLIQKSWKIETGMLHTTNFKSKWYSKLIWQFIDRAILLHWLSNYTA